MIAKIAHCGHSDITKCDKSLFVLSSGYYRLSDTAELSDGISELSERTPEYPLHCIRENGRNDFHLNYMQHGRSEFVINGEKIIAEEGDIIFYDYGDPQEYTHLDGFDTQVYWVHFDGEKAREILNDIGITQSGVFHTNINLSEYFENIIREMTHKSNNYNKLVAGNMYIILANILRKNSKTDDKLNYVISLMNSMENNHMTLDEYANICHLSKSQFIRRFRNYTGQTPISYKNKIIVRDAQWYLENSKYSVSEIADILQFENVYYFSSMFKKAVGISPIRWRERSGAT